MAHVALTGANGFLGWHTRCALESGSREIRSIPVGERFDALTAAAALEGSERFIHIAGVNRAEDEVVLGGNTQFAEQMAGALLATDSPPRTVVYANSTQVGNGTVYGLAKARAGEILFEAAEKVGSEFVDITLPNLFGEHGRPFYNSVVATFCHLLALGGEPEVENDKELMLLHAQDAADLLLGSASAKSAVVQCSVSEILRKLAGFARAYALGDIPNIEELFDRNLFNTYRSFIPLGEAGLRLGRRADSRGSLFEVVRTYGGGGQASFSTTLPGMSRGDHFHRRKFERFVILSGDATISLRKLFSTEAVDMVVSGDSPVAVDVPTMWVHRITNTGERELYTALWSNETFDSQSPDTYVEVI